MSSGKKYFKKNNFFGRLGARNYVNFNDNFKNFSHMIYKSEGLFPIVIIGATLKYFIALTIFYGKIQGLKQITKRKL